MVNSTLLNFGKTYKDDLRVIFDQWPMLHLGFDVEPEIGILKVILYEFFCKVRYCKVCLKTYSILVFPFKDIVTRLVRTQY